MSFVENWGRPLTLSEGLLRLQIVTKCNGPRHLQISITQILESVWLDSKDERSTIDR